MSGRLIFAERHGDWLAEVRRVDVKAFGGRTLWHWSFGHTVAGVFASGFHATREQALAETQEHLGKWKRLGE